MLKMLLQRIMGVYVDSTKIESFKLFENDIKRKILINYFFKYEIDRDICKYYIKNIYFVNNV